MACLGWLQNLAIGGGASTAVTVAGLPSKRHWILPNGIRFYGTRTEVEALLRRSQPEHATVVSPVKEDKQSNKGAKPPLAPQAVSADEPYETVQLEPYIRPVEQVETDHEDAVKARRRRKAIELLLMAA